MKVCVWKTGHEIADTVARAIGGNIYDTKDCNQNIIDAYDIHVGYGILRGMADVFARAAKANKPYFNLDRGYINPGHFDGKYRISLNGTQQVGSWPDPIPHSMPLQPWRGFDENKPILVCPPTDVVAEFFNVYGWRCVDGVVRRKGNPNPINFQDYNYVCTFNSSVGWQAIAAGIPCISDTTFSMVGSFF
jgi:hypothetical protein